ncbi:ATP-dependent nuclease [Rodentibacter ratti]|uniref:ATP-dependent nuclease n=1 Tax=Rodentibacter ratti TaxID=1906745 RepID=UPI00117A45F2|nr:AAA family ATPase [Rodentibacter ratti]
MFRNKKVFEISNNKVKEKVFAVCNHPTTKGYDDLLLVKNKELQTRAKKVNKEEDALPFTASAPLRKLIWNSCETLNLMLKDIELEKEDAKNIYSKIEEYMPLYALFQSDRDNSDDNKEVTDPMKLAVQEALKSVEDELNEIKRIVKDKATETANRTLEKLKEMDPSIASTLSVDFKVDPKFDNAFKLSIASDDNISINKRGSGIRRLILLNFFRAEVEKRKNNKNSSVIYAFEEPETSQHPNNQEVIIKTFLELSELDSTQVILTTHTPNLAKLLPVDSLRFVTKDSNHNVVKFSDKNIYREISESLGLIPKSIKTKTKCIMLVEGPYDVKVYQDISKKLKEIKSTQYDFSDKGIQVVFVGGCGTLEFWVNTDFAKELNIPIVAYFDSDKIDSKEKSTKNIDKVNELIQKKVISLGFCTKKRELENYLHSDIFKEFDKTYEVSDFGDIKDEVNKLNGVTVRKAKVLEKFWSEMTAERLKEREQYIGNDNQIYYEFTENFNKIYHLLDEV